LTLLVLFSPTGDIKNVIVMVDVVDVVIIGGRRQRARLLRQFLDDLMAGLFLLFDEIYFRMIGVWASLSDAVRSWLRLLTHVKFIPHP
jgi:hypothetical protein